MEEDKEDVYKLSASEVGEDATKYGEFVSSYFAWISLPNQKERVEELEKMTQRGTKQEENDIKQK